MWSSEEYIIYSVGRNKWSCFIRRCMFSVRVFIFLSSSEAISFQYTVIKASLSARHVRIIAYSIHDQSGESI